MQDSNFNWVHPLDEEWGKRAVTVYEEMLRRLKNHPSIFCWVCLNEPRDEYYLNVCPVPQMLEVTKRLDPHRSFILSSGDINEPLSGDSHNYDGSLNRPQTHYTDYDKKLHLL
jgi:beta-galactosidase/beta-glucuronidase